MSYSTLGSKVVSETLAKEPLALTVYVSGHPIFRRNSIWGPLQINSTRYKYLQATHANLTFKHVYLPRALRHSAYR